MKFIDWDSDNGWLGVLACWIVDLSFMATAIGMLLFIGWIFDKIN